LSLHPAEEGVFGGDGAPIPASNLFAFKEYFFDKRAICGDLRVRVGLCYHSIVVAWNRDIAEGDLRWDLLLQHWRVKLCYWRSRRFQAKGLIELVPLLLKKHCLGQGLQQRARFGHLRLQLRNFHSQHVDFRCHGLICVLIWADGLILLAVDRNLIDIRRWLVGMYRRTFLAAFTFGLWIV